MKALLTTIKLLGAAALSYYLWYMVQVGDEHRVCKGFAAFVALCVVLILFSIPEYRYKHNVLKSWLQSFERIVKYDIVAKEYQSRIMVFRLRLGLFIQLRYVGAGFCNLGHLVRAKRGRAYFKNWPRPFRQYYCLWDRVNTQREFMSLTYMYATRNGEHDNGIVDYCYKNEKEIVVAAPTLETTTLPSSYPRRGGMKDQIDKYLKATYLTKDSYSHLLTMSQLSSHFIAVPLRKPSQERWGVLLLEIKEEGIPNDVLSDAKEKMILASQLFQSLQNVI